MNSEEYDGGKLMYIPFLRYHLLSVSSRTDRENEYLEMVQLWDVASMLPRTFQYLIGVQLGKVPLLQLSRRRGIKEECVRP